MSTHAITGAAATAPLPNSAVPSQAPSTSSSGKAAAAVISAVTAALTEASETGAQTTREAARGDKAAQNILAKQQAASVERKAASTSSSKQIGSQVDVKA